MSDRQDLDAPTQSEALEKSEPQYKRLQAHEIAKIMTLSASGVSVPAIAKALGREDTTVYRCLERVSIAPDIADKYLKSQALQAAMDWSEASGRAAKRGNHVPARDLLVATGVVEPENQQTGAKVTVIVGVPGSPLPAVSSQVIDTKALSDTTDK